MSKLTQVTEYAFTITKIFSLDECQFWIEYSENEGYTQAPITTALGPIMRPDIRNNTRVMVDDTKMAEVLWQRIAPYIKEMDGKKPVGVNERMRFYRYDPGQVFKPHHDGYFQRENGERSKLTFMIYLNEGFKGGQTRFITYNKGKVSIDVVPRTGMALLFEHAVLHEGVKLEEGRKYVLRTDVMFQ